MTDRQTRERNKRYAYQSDAYKGMSDQDYHDIFAFNSASDCGLLKGKRFTPPLSQDMRLHEDFDADIKVTVTYKGIADDMFRWEIEIFVDGHTETIEYGRGFAHCDIVGRKDHVRDYVAKYNNHWMGTAYDESIMRWAKQYTGGLALAAQVWVLPKPPNIDDAMQALCQDASLALWLDSPDDVASEFGVDPTEAERIFDGCTDALRKLHRLASGSSHPVDDFLFVYG